MTRDPPSETLNLKIISICMGITDQIEQVFGISDPNWYYGMAIQSAIYRIYQERLPEMEKAILS